MTYTNELKIAAALCELAGLEPVWSDDGDLWYVADYDGRPPERSVVRWGAGMIELAHHLKWALGVEDAEVWQSSMGYTLKTGDDSDLTCEYFDGTALGEAAALIRLMGRAKGVEL